jgi:hypothetical protein
MGTDPSIPAALRPCTPIASADDLAVYETYVQAPFHVAIQNNREASGLITWYAPWNCVGEICAIMTNSSTSQLAALANAVTFMAPWIKDPCIDSSWADNVGSATNITIDGEAAWRQWQWLMCNEFGWFGGYQTTGKDHPFAALASQTLDMSVKYCRQAFGLGDEYDELELQRRVEWTNTNYGDRSLLAQNVVLSNGNVDFYSALGFVNKSDPFFESCTGTGPCPPQASTTANRTVVYISGSSHMGDWNAPGWYDRAPWYSPDSPSVQWAHAAVGAAVGRFIA